MGLGKRKITFEGKTSKKELSGLTVEGVREVKKSMVHVLQKTEFEEEAAEALEIMEMLQDHEELSVDDFYTLIGDESDEDASKFGGGI